MLAAVEEQLHEMRARHLEGVFDDDPALALKQRDAPPVLHRVVQPRISVVPALEDIALGRRAPEAALGARLAQPHEVAARLGLVLRVDARGIVRARSTKIAAPSALGMERVGA